MCKEKLLGTARSSEFVWMPEAMGAPGCTPLLLGIGSGPNRTELSFEQQRSQHLASAGATDFPAFSMSMVRKHCLLLL